MENHLTVEDLGKMKPQERLNTAKGLWKIGKERTMNILIHPEEQRQIVEDVYEKAWKAYMQYVKEPKI